LIRQISPSVGLVVYGRSSAACAAVISVRKPVMKSASGVGPHVVESFITLPPQHLTAQRGPPRRLPPRDGGLVQPERQVTTPPQPGLVGRPVLDPIASFRDAVTPGSH